MLFEQLGLSANILRAVTEEGYEHPTPIQEKAIPAILEGKDVMGGAQTGTGKTAGFTLPMLRRLEVYANTSMSPARHPLRTLVLVPTRELAIQVFESIQNYSKYTALRSALVYGGVNIDSQVNAVRSGIEILVATPGRLLDHIQQKNLVLSNVEILILDEADRMLDMGFLPDIKKIVSFLPGKRQNLMFSATFSDEIKKLANQILNEPILIEVAKQNSVNDSITHVVYAIQSASKSELLIHLIKEKNLKQALIFNRTKTGADRLKKILDKHNISAAVIHGNKNQLQRNQAFNEFKQGTIQTLVATDVAARGLDIEELSCVINFELPNNPEDYIHRIGRTGRAGTKGYAISLVSSEEKKLLVGIEKLLQKSIQIEKIAKFEKNTVKNNKLKEKSEKNGRNDKNIKHNLPEKNNTSKTVDKRTEVIYFNGEQVSRDNAPKTPKTSVNDPLFTQPYISSIPEEKLNKDFNDNQVSFRHKNRRYLTKTVPALFVPPVNK
ncbi:ATP-dependent RNA helicase RhlE [Nitrosomonas sp. Nm51]|uniref:DEAD/DEAH box helicase n=1 Tax=Nitrosomonas sp. Nm51 TaxID=133720 RepID=UPI0008D4EC3C|nr:DEAD/DEAH box helicase [Nitrosomonas sp. Nm51]SER83748.1 ATP-dependent RNA helicase RhlE [Nitrosomonas sp. Nm51]